MFELVKIRDTVRIPPEKFGEKMKEASPRFLTMIK